MTVCIANAIGISSETNKIVCVSDLMLANEFASADSSTFKIRWIGDRWLAMFSGSTSPTVPILKSVIETSDKTDTLEAMVAAFTGAIKKQRTLAIEQSILSPLGLSLAEFLKSRDDLGDANFDNLKYQIDNFDLEVEFLAAGFDSTGSPHIFSIADRMPVQYHDALGFYAIGTGSISAMGMLYNTRDRWATEEESIFRTFEAKFVAEPAPGVGRKTLAMVIEPSGKSSMFTDDQAERIKKLWKKMGKPKLPSKTLDSIKEELDKASIIETGKNKGEEETK